MFGNDRRRFLADARNDTANVGTRRSSGDLHKQIAAAPSPLNNDAVIPNGAEAQSEAKGKAE
jgi:hypothetical protein